MEKANLNVLNTELRLSMDKPNQLILHNESGTLQILSNPAILQVPTQKVKLLSIAMQGPAGSGLTSLQDDPNPTLGGDLILGPYKIIGDLDNTTFVLDGGLL